MILSGSRIWFSIEASDFQTWFQYEFRNGIWFGNFLIPILGSKFRLWLWEEISRILESLFMEEDQLYFYTYLGRIMVIVRSWCRELDQLEVSSLSTRA